MITSQLSRAQLVGAVEAGINAAPTLPNPAKTSLRNVATTIDRVGVGVFCTDGGCVGCPMTVAGITDTQGDLTLLAQALGVTTDELDDFTSNFDRIVDIYIITDGGVTSDVVEVV